MQQSTTVQPARPSISSRSSHRLMWSRANGRAMRIHCTPGATSRVVALRGQGIAKRVNQLLFKGVHRDPGSKI